MSMKNLFLSLSALILFAAAPAVQAQGWKVTSDWQMTNQEYVRFLNNHYVGLDLSVSPVWVSNGPVVFENLEKLEGVLQGDFKVEAGAFDGIFSCRIRECHGGGGTGPIPFATSQLLPK